jgi:signal transduction histidine kinase
MRNLTIKHKLIAITMLTCITALLLSGSWYVVWEWTNLRKQIIQDLSTHTEMIAENCKAALAFDDAKDAQKTLSSLTVKSSIVSGCIYDKKGNIFADYYRDENHKKYTKLNEAKPDGYFFKDGSLTVIKTILLEKDIIGTACLQSDLQSMYAMLKRNIQMVFFIILQMSLIAYFVSSRLQRIVSVPILDLACVAKYVSEKKDYSARAASRSNDEIGLLINTFNQMLERIQQQNMAMLKINTELEEKVKLRTADITATNELLTKEIADRQKIEAGQDKLLKTVEKTNQELQDFAYIISHDLKAPLRGISTLADWITTDYADKLDNDGKEQLKLLTARVNRMHNLIEGVLQYSRVGRIRETQVEVNLNELITEVVDMLCPPENIKITVETELPTIMCEKTRIMQVFQNLLSNAIKYMDKPEGTIQITCTEQDNVWQFSVTDNGPGIESKYFEKIFQIFQTLAPKDTFESTGVGLTVAKKIVEMYGGRIWVESVPTEGTTFYFTLSKQETEIKNAQYQTHNVG